MKNKGLDKDFLKNIIVEKESLNTVKSVITHFVCLLFPVAAVFGGYFLSKPLWKCFSKTELRPQWFCFVCSLILFVIAALIIFFKTRNTNPIIRIRVLKEKNSSEQ